MSYDRRLTPARADLAAAYLIDQIRAPKYAKAEACRVAVAVAPLHPSPDRVSVQDTELLFGEGFDVYDRADGWAWGQSEIDGYVGYIAEASLVSADGPTPNARVTALVAATYSEPRLKSSPSGRLSFGARVLTGRECDRFLEIGPENWIPAPQIAPIEDSCEDWVSIAELFLGVPYVWGGRSSSGLDCSALIQLARQAAGHDCPRDSDMQQKELGQTLDPGARLERGDLVFWRGHVGVMLDEMRLLHANGHHMAVRIEPLDDAIGRIAKTGDGEVTRRARLDVDTTSH